MEKRRVPLGTLLVEGRLITPGQLDDALSEHRRTGRRLGAVLIDRRLITSARLTQVLSFQLSLPWVTLHQLSPSAELIALVPKPLAARHRLVPVFVRKDKSGKPSLYVATDDPTNDAGLVECAKLTRTPVLAMVAAPDDVSQALLRHYGVPPTVMPPPPRRPPLPVVAAKPQEAATVPARRPPSDATEVVAGALRAHVTEMPPASLPEPPASLDAGPRSLPGDAKPGAGPPVLLVGARAEFVRRCRDAAGDRITISVAGLKDVRERAQAKRPIALIVMEDLYAFDRLAFSRLAGEIGAQLVIWNDELDVDFLEPVLETARGGGG